MSGTARRRCSRWPDSASLEPVSAPQSVLNGAQMPRASNDTLNADTASGVLAAHSARELLVLAEHAKSLFGQLPTALAGSLIAAVLIVAYFWPVVNHLIAGSWLVLLVLCH